MRCFLYRPDVIEKGKSRMRIRVANASIVLTLLGCAAMVWSGKRAHRRGESISGMNKEWHRKYNEEQAEKEKAQSK